MKSRSSGIETSRSSGSEGIELYPEASIRESWPFALRKLLQRLQHD